MVQPASMPATVQSWTTDHFHDSVTTDAWESALSDSYGHWRVDQAVAAGFAAHIRKREFDGLRVVECECDPCSGKRAPSLINRDGEPFIGVQVTRSGRERFHLDAEVLEVGAGDLVIWSSEMPAEFTVIERLSKVSLILPWADVQERLPRVTRFTGTVLDSRCGIGAVLFSHIDHLARQMELFTIDDQAAVKRATLELLVAGMSHRIEAPQRGLAQRYLRQLQDYILAHLQDETLSPMGIAAANHMSLRYVHMLFAQTNTGVASWIRQQRLERCRQALESCAFHDVSVSEIAHQWAFTDPSHFARVFRLQYGCSPSEWREQALRRI